jgi:hypothetical protein
MTSLVVGWASGFLLAHRFAGSAWADDRAVCPPYSAVGCGDDRNRIIRDRCGSFLTAALYLDLRPCILRARDVPTKEAHQSDDARWYTSFPVLNP